MHNALASHTICAVLAFAASATLSAAELTHRWSFNGDYSDSVGEAVVLIRPRAVATPRPIKIRAETVRHGKYAPASGELVFTPGVAVVKVVSHGTSGLANDARLRQVEAQQREFEAKE